MCPLVPFPLEGTLEKSAPMGKVPRMSWTVCPSGAFLDSVHIGPQWGWRGSGPPFPGGLLEGRGWGKLSSHLTPGNALLSEPAQWEEDLRGLAATGSPVLAC